MIFNKGGFSVNPKSVLLFTGESKFVMNDDGWQLDLLSSGILTPLKTFRSLDVFILGGGGAGGGAYGGGGYYQTLYGIRLEKNTDFQIVVGEGGNSVGLNGETSSAFGFYSEGGNAAVSGSSIYADCTVFSSGGTAGNLYYYDSLTSDAVSQGQGYHDVRLKYPFEQVKHQNGTVLYTGYPSGYYRCVIQETNNIEYAPGVNGIGAEETNMFETGELVSGSGNESVTLRKGQGGNLINVRGGKGVVSIRHTKRTTDTSSLGEAVLDQMILL